MRISRTTGKEAPRIEIAATVTHTRRASALSPKGLSNNPILLSLSLSYTWRLLYPSFHTVIRIFSIYSRY